jgi:hypothetical protein
MKHKLFLVVMTVLPLTFAAHGMADTAQSAKSSPTVSISPPDNPAENPAAHQNILK